MHLGEPPVKAVHVAQPYTNAAHKAACLLRKVIFRYPMSRKKFATLDHIIMDGRAGGNKKRLISMTRHTCRTFAGIL